MAILNCPRCTRWLATVDDVGWRILSKDLDVVIDDVLTASDDLWSDLELAQKRSDEWRDRGVYDPMPPGPDPRASSVTLRCPCGVGTRFERPD